MWSCGALPIASFAALFPSSSNQYKRLPNVCGKTCKVRLSIMRKGMLVV